MLSTSSSHRALLAFSLAFAFGSAISNPASAQTFPANAQSLCPVTSAAFASWFQSGHPSLNGAVVPANSVTFPHNSNCAFYAWSKQMFLWLTSPAPKTYGGNSIVLNSPVFFDVSPEDSSGKRHFIPHTINFIPSFVVRGQKPGPGNVPLVISKTGQVLRFRNATSGQRPMVRGAGGKMVELKSAVRVTGQIKLTDATGKDVPRTIPKSIAATAHLPLKNAPILTRFIINGIPIFIDPFGNVIDTEEGQATGDVLLAQNGSLVYYTISVNDVYAYFLTQNQDAVSQFPTTQTQLTSIQAYASQNFGVTFPDPDALAIEVKTAWVEASSLPNTNGYITEMATIPTFNTSNPNKWVPTGQKTTKLAMVGMHVVGSAAGHPEMIWSTFERFGNAPNGSYQYINQSGTVVTVPPEGAGPWLLTSAHPGSPNQSHAEISSGDIVSKNGFTITPSDTLRVDAFGSSTTDAPNPLVTSAAQSNSQVISIQNSVNAMMPAGDIRGNYYLSGSTWTNSGAIPTTSYGSVHNPTGNVIGTSQINNSTMETYFQPPSTTFTTAIGNCMICHATAGTNGKVDTNVSHIYSDLVPLVSPKGSSKQAKPK